MTENDILGFDPSQLSVFNVEEAPKSQGNSLIYRTRPADSKSEDGIYRCTIKVIYNPFDLKHSVLEQQSYSMQDVNGYFSAVSSLTNNDTSCPIFKAWKKCRYAEQGSDLWKQQAKREEGGYALFDKRFARYCVIQVLSDKNQPDLEGKYMFWKLPKAVWDIINAKMNPSRESGKAAIPVMDYLFGRSVDLEVIPGPDDPAHPERKTRETSYMAELSEDVVSCVNPDGSPILNDADQMVLDTYVSEMSKIWRSKDPAARAEMLQTVAADANTQALKTIYTRVLEDIKKVCPNLIEKMGYNGWDEALTTRVQNWIDVVLSCGNPATTIKSADAFEAAKVAETPKEEISHVYPASDPISPATMDNSDSDLPF